jgi:MFS family permease
MKEKTDKIMTLALLGLAILTTAVAFAFALNTVNGGLFDIAFWLLVAMLVVSLGAIVLFLIKKLAERFKTEKGYAKKFIFLVVGIIVLLALSFLLSKANDVDLIKYGITEGTSKLIGAACVLCYILCIGAVVAIVVVECLPKTNKKK